LDDKSSDLPNKRKTEDQIQPAVSPAKRFCRFGARHEEHEGAGNNPGFKCDRNPSMTPEGHGFANHLVFWIPRNTTCSLHRCGGEIWMSSHCCTYLILRIHIMRASLPAVNTCLVLNYSHSRNPPCAPARTHGQIQAPREPPN
jgi:hypothetical protein